jgi:hypothetical protein
MNEPNLSMIEAEAPLPTSALRFNAPAAHEMLPSSPLPWTLTLPPPQYRRSTAKGNRVFYDCCPAGEGKTFSIDTRRLKSYSSAQGIHNTTSPTL